MRLSDRLSGLLALATGLAVVFYTRTFPDMPGQNIGPALFPSLAGAGLAVFGLWLVVADARTGRAPLVTFDDWAAKPRMVVNVLVVAGLLVAYILLADALGFLVIGVAFLSALMVAFDANRRWILPAAIVMTFAIHYAFYTLLRVALPWGVLRGVAW